MAKAAYQSLLAPEKGKSGPEVAQMDAVGRLSVAIERIADRDAEIESLRASLLNADLALQSVSLSLGGTDEWSDQETMIADVKRLAEESASWSSPGAADLTFGSLLNEMIRHMFVRVETLDPDAPHRLCVRCSQCDGDDQHRAIGQRPSLSNVNHKPDCLLGKHLPRLHTMASRDVT